MAFRSFLVRIFTRASYTSTVIITISFLFSSNLLSQSHNHLLISQSIEIIDTQSDVISDDLLLSLEGAFRIRPNRKFIGMTWRLWAYKTIRPSSLSKSLERRARKNKEPGGLRYGVKELFGEPPAYFDNDELARTSSKMIQILNQEGYLQARAGVYPDSSHISGWGAIFRIHLGERWTIDSISWNTKTSGLPVNKIKSATLLKKGDPLSMKTLQLERSRISTIAGSLGYATFNEGFIKFSLDTLHRHTGVNLEVVLRGQRLEGTETNIKHVAMKIGSILFDQSEMTRPLRHSLLEHLVTLEEGVGFDPEKFESSYRRLTRVSALKGVEIKKDFPINSGDDLQTVDVTIKLQDNPRYNVALEFDMTRADTRYGPLGKFTWTDRNVSRRGDVISITVSTSVASTQPFSYSSTSIVPNSGEFGFIGSYRIIGLPPKRLKTLPKSTSPYTEWIIQAAKESRPEYTSSSFDYIHRVDWVENASRNSKINVDVLHISYVKMNISADFEEWLDGENDALLRYRFSDYALSGSRVGWTSLLGSEGGNVALGFEWSGVLSKALSPLLRLQVTDNGGVLISDVPIIKFARIDGSWVVRKAINQRPDQTFATRFRFGSTFLGKGTEAIPYDRGFYGGGANGVRGWPVRELGPGLYSETDPIQGVLRGVGDIRLDASAEFRIKWSPFATVAMFADLGNVWLHKTSLSNYVSLIESGWESVAVSTGVGLRLDFDFFLVRFDYAVRLHDPTRIKGQRWMIEKMPSGAFHLGLGHPF
ncbi:MAG: hypothetical protein COA49_04815 [Bacteroidetes bacterium]|nr:MAG: hypothetical protein COA49_04815 [Bacteroidota bacterium]